MEAAGYERQTTEDEEGQRIRHRLRPHPHHTQHAEHEAHNTQKGGQQSRPKEGRGGWGERTTRRGVRGEEQNSGGGERGGGGREGRRPTSMGGGELS